MKYIYHIAKASDWARALQQGAYTVGSLHRNFSEDGFIHMAYAQQVNVIADLIYSKTPDLVLLTIDPTKVTAEIKEERADYPAELFPHLYGPLNSDAVVAVDVYEPLPTGHFPVVSARPRHL